MYSYRQLAQKDLEAAMKLAADTGFIYIECNNPFGRTPEQYRAMIEKNGMKPISKNFPLNEWENKLDETVDQAVRLGVKFSGTTSIPYKGKMTETDIRHAASVFNKAGDALAKHGIMFSYHNHGHEFEPYQDGTLFDLLVSLTNPKTVTFEMDTTWVVFPFGEDPVKLLKKYPTRFKLMHLKDFKKQENKKYGGSVPLCTGCVDIVAILSAAQYAGVEYYYIEDEASQPEKDIPASLKNLESL